MDTLKHKCFEILGRRDDVLPTYGSKRAKVDYGNQNARVNSGKDPFSFDTDPEKTDPAAVKPKKFFKSRNAASTAEETRPDAAIYRQVPDSQYGRSRPPKQPQQLSSRQLQKASVAQQKKVQETLTTGTNQVPNKEEGKPPIVLRICKGTARLICGDLDSESESYRISSPSASPTKIDVERKSPSTPISKLDTRATRSAHQPLVTTVSVSQDDSDTRRTTRSRSKNLRDIISPTTVAPAAIVTSNSHSSGLSLTLRKSVTDSNNTLISHYDIVKTDCNTSYGCKPSVEPLIGRDQPLPTTTQELIDILSSDPDLSQRAAIPMETNSDDDQEEEILEEEILHYSEEPLSEIAESNEHEPEPELEAEPEKEIGKELTQSTDVEAPTAKTMVDQDWFSGSEDSEGTPGNVENEIPVSIHEERTNVIQPSPPRNDVSISKPSTKKGSIFKSRSAGTTNGNKRRALYKHKWSDNDKESPATDNRNTESQISNVASSSHTDTNTVAFEEEFENAELTRVVTYPETDMDFTDDLEAVTSIRCGKKVKGVSIFSND